MKNQEYNCLVCVCSLFFLWIIHCLAMPHPPHFILSTVDCIKVVLFLRLL
uniref:Uncharacterized protein n=1 Tax=Anopheles arabiensis TaxID=7173 RepID=A0A182IFP0_ANOAR